MISTIRECSKSKHFNTIQINDYGHIVIVNEKSLVFIFFKHLKKYEEYYILEIYNKIYIFKGYNNEILKLINDIPYFEIEKKDINISLFDNNKIKYMEYIPNIILEKYSEKSYILHGSGILDYFEYLTLRGFTYNKYLKVNNEAAPGFIIPKRRLDNLKYLLKSINIIYEDKNNKTINIYNIPKRLKYGNL